MSNKLVVKYLSGNCSESEKVQVEQWLAVSVQNRKKFEKLKLVWTLSSAKNFAEPLNIESALEKVHDRIEKFDQPQQFIQRRPSLFSTYGRKAAAVAAIFLIGVFSIYLIHSNADPEIITVDAGSSKTQTIVLPDGTKVFLNADARISYPETFTDSERRIEFEGEAFFEVSKDIAKPFIITATNIGVEVLGTSFNLKAISSKNDYQLDLKSGKVLLYSINPETKTKLEQIVLLSGERGSLSNSAYTLLKEKNINENYLAWHTGLLVFENASLSEVVKALQQTYHVDISLDPALNNLKLTARFPNQKIESILETLHVIFACNIVVNDSTIAIN
jgi:ferric-dicitrate binding protein FerR (iron transport regulator)